MLRAGLLLGLSLALVGVAMAQPLEMSAPEVEPSYRPADDVALQSAFDEPAPPPGDEAARETPRAEDRDGPGGFGAHGWMPETSELVDPWQARPVQAARAARLDVRGDGVSSSWAKPVPEIVDPWQPPPASGWAERVPLIVDPWQD